jgi:hypothetical protein
MTSPQEQFAAAVRRSQAAATDVLQAWNTIARSATDAVQGGKPATVWDSDELIDQVFNVAERMLADQRELLKKLVHLSAELSENARQDAAAFGGTVSAQVGEVASAARTRTEDALESARERAEAARQVAVSATEQVLQTARDGTQSLVEAARQHLPFLESASDSSEPTTAPALELAAAPADEPAAEPAPERKPAARKPARPKAATKKPAAASYEGLTKPQLQALLVERGLPKSGNVAELRARLAAAD